MSSIRNVPKDMPTSSCEVKKHGPLLVGPRICQDRPILGLVQELARIILGTFKMLEESLLALRKLKRCLLAIESAIERCELLMVRRR